MFFVQTADRKTHPLCDPCDYKSIITNPNILVFFQLHQKGCLTCSFISNTNGVEYTLLPHLCMPGRDNAYVPTNSSMYCPQLLRMECPNKRRELIRKINNLCTGCWRRCGPNSACFHCTASKRKQPGKPCLG